MKDVIEIHERGFLNFALHSISSNEGF